MVTFLIDIILKISLQISQGTNAFKNIHRITLKNLYRHLMLLSNVKLEICKSTLTVNQLCTDISSRLHTVRQWVTCVHI